MIDAGSLGSAARPPLFVGRKGVPPGDLAAFTVRSFTLPMSRSMSDMSGRPAGVARNSSDWEALLGAGVRTEDCVGPSGTVSLEPRRTCLIGQ